MHTEALETIRICLEQKSMFMTSIFDVTKQLQVRASEEDITFDDLLELREVHINRIDRCDALIKGKLIELDSDEQEVMQVILTETQILHLNTSEEPYLTMHKYVVEYNGLLQQTRELDNQVMHLVKAKHTDLKGKINEIRKKRAKTNKISV